MTRTFTQTKIKFLKGDGKGGFIQDEIIANGNLKGVYLERYQRKNLKNTVILSTETIKQKYYISADDFLLLAKPVSDDFADEEEENQ